MEKRIVVLREGCLLLDRAMCVVKMAGGRKGDRCRKRKRVSERLHTLE